MAWISALKAAAKRLPLVRELVTERDALYQDVQALRGQVGVLKGELQKFETFHKFAPPGHFYSPYAALDDIRKNEQAIFHSRPSSLPGLDLRAEEQLSLLERLARFYPQMAFKAQKTADLRYYYENSAYSYSDAIIFHCMMRHLKPRRIIEVGSGFSSCMTLDTNELFFGNTIDCTFIEPYPALLTTLIKPEDQDRVNIVPSRLQDVELSRFEALEANDILFIDSTHVAKVHSDVNILFFEILPRLTPGVYIHIHDVFYPFEYPSQWIYEGRAWNEAYMLRAFLEFNDAFRIILMNTYLQHFNRSFFEHHMPLCLKDPGGSIWLQRC